MLRPGLLELLAHMRSVGATIVVYTHSEEKWCVCACVRACVRVSSAKKKMKRKHKSTQTQTGATSLVEVYESVREVSCGRKGGMCGAIEKVDKMYISAAVHY
jgi:hypothetical protein